jgi:MFS family permease
MKVKEVTLKDKKEKSLEYSVKDGCAWATMVGFGENYISPFAIALNATNQQIALLASMPQLLSSLFQLLSAKLTDLIKNRKKIIIWGVIIQALIWFPLFYFPFLTKNVYLLVAFVAVYFTAGSFVNPAWNSWMGDLVEENKRGSYFGSRNQLIGVFTLISLFLGGFILSKFTQINVFYGFGAIFLIALIARLLSAYYLKKMYEPKYIVQKKDYFGFVDFVKRMRTTNYGIFVLFIFFFRLSVEIAGPFFAVYMLKDLHMSYLAYTALTAASTVVTFLAMPHWGRYTDKFGNRTILKITAFLIPILPLFWLFSRNFVYLFLVQIVSGFLWAGFNLSASNFMFDTVKPTKRATAVSYYNVFYGVAVFCGSMIGGALVLKIIKPSFLISNLQILFLISGILRLLVVLYFMPKIKEARIKGPVQEREVLVRAVAIDPIKGLVYESITGIKKVQEIGEKSVDFSLKKVKDVVKETEEIIVDINEKARKISEKESKRRLREKKKLIREFEEFTKGIAPKKKKQG